MNQTQNEILNRVLLNHDSEYQETLFVTPRTHIFEYTDGKWSQMNVEGTMYLYRKNDQSESIVIFNKKAPNTFQIDLKEVKLIEIENEFLTVTETSIFGVLFDGKADAECIYNEIERNMLKN